MSMHCDSRKARTEAQGRGLVSRAGERRWGPGRAQQQQIPGRRTEGGGGQTHVPTADATQGGEKRLLESGRSGKTTRPHREERLLTGPSKQAGLPVRLVKGEGTPARGQARGRVLGQLDAEHGHLGSRPPWTPGPRERLPEETPIRGAWAAGRWGRDTRPPPPARPPPCSWLPPSLTPCADPPALYSETGLSVKNSRKKKKQEIPRSPVHRPSENEIPQLPSGWGWVPLLCWRLWALLNRHTLGSPGVHLQLGAICSSGR